MAIPVAVPIIGAVTLVGLGLLKLRQYISAKSAKAVVAAPAAPTATVAKTTVISVTPAAKTASAALLPAYQAPYVAERDRYATVVTKDAAPSGDLVIRNSPNGSQIGGAEKNGLVIVLRDVDSIWAEILWEGGPRLPAAQGYAKKQFLKLAEAGMRKADVTLDAAREAAQANPTPENIAAAMQAAIEAEDIPLVEQTS